MKKIISIITLIIISVTNNLLFITYAVNTNQQSTPWTITKAEHLAKKTLFGASKEKVLELYNAGSAISAVNLLFPSIEGPDRTSYNTKMESILDISWLIETNKAEMNQYYTIKKMDDPYEAKAKLFGVFEDTFSVNTKYGRINYGDIESTYNLLYSNTLGNYKEMVKRNLYNNGNKGDYSLGEYLDLFNQKNPKYPNENYAREVMQLFLMLEYKPTESEDKGNTRNYTEEDVASIAKLLFGFEADENTHKVTYNGSSNTNTEVSYLEGGLKNGDSFPFYSTASGTINITKMKESINGNNGLPDNLIDYIFSKREDAISIFLADKLYRFYVAQDPSRADLNIIASEIKNNDFEIYSTVKWLLAQDMMYSEKSMNDIIYKNPLELIIGTSKILGLNSDDLILKYSLSNLSWKGYGVGKIFGRDGFDHNEVFFTPYIANKWTSESSILANKLIDNNLAFLSGSTTATGIIQDLENKLYLGKRLDNNTKEKLVTYLTTDSSGNKITVDLNDSGYIAKNVHGVIYMMLNQPEYILQSGYDKINIKSGLNNPFYNNNSKLVLIKASGGLDWLHAFVPKNEYSEYLELRGTGAITGTGLISLNDNYYINSALSPFKELYDTGNFKIINRVGTPSNSRGHDSASRKITSLNNLYESSDEGIFGHFIKEENASKTIVLDGGSKPLILRNGRYMGIGSSAVYKVNSGKISISNDEKNYKLNTLKDILINRNYSGEFGEVFKSSAIIDSVARDSKANGGREGSGYNMQQKFSFLESMYNAGMGNTAWLRADGGYDTHKNQKLTLNNNFTKVANATAEFFNKVKGSNDVTIIIYSEFGRTKKLNASNGVDHGMGGGMFIITNNKNLNLTELPKTVYGNLSFKNSKNNWLGVGIDYRSVYSKVYKALYNRDTINDFGGEYDINTYIDNTIPETQTLWYDHKQYSGNSYNTHIKFNVDDTNFFSNQGSYIKFEYWSDTNPVKEISKYQLNRTRITEKDYDISFRTTGNKKYYYKITIYDNQYNKKIIEGDFTTPKNQNTLSNLGSTYISRFKNIDLSSNIILNNSSTGIILSNSGTIELTGITGSKILVNSGTYVTEIIGGTGSTWNGIFTNPTEVNIKSFIGNSSIYNGKKINNYKISKIIKIGANDLGVGLNLNKNVTIEVKDINVTKKYIILTSKDGINWLNILNPNIKKLSNSITFETKSFSYFAIVESDSEGNPIINVIINSSIPEKNRTTGNSSGTPRFKKDICPYGDFSVSYYDKTCGIDPYLMNTRNYSKDSKSVYKNEKEIEIAYLELKVKEQQSAKIYEEVLGIDIENENGIDFSIVDNDTQKEILTLLREKISSIKIGGYKLVYIKKSNLNNIFKKIGTIFIKKNFSEKKTTKLFEYLNEVIIFSAINELVNIDKEIKSKNKILLKESIKNLITLYKSKNISIKKILPSKITNKKKITGNNIDENFALVRRKETVTEKIIRINKKRKNLLKK